MKVALSPLKTQETIKLKLTVRESVGSRNEEQGSGGEI